MLKRYFLVGIIWMLCSLPLAAGVVTSENQLPWLIALGLVFVAFAVFGNWYIFYGGPDQFDPETGLRRPHMFRTLFIYLIGVMFLLLAAKLALRSSVFGFGLWADYLLSDAEDHNPLSTPRLLGWVISSISFFVASLFLFLKSKKAVIVMLTGIIAYLSGAAIDHYIVNQGNYFPGAIGELTGMGPGLVIFFAATLMMRAGGDLR
jgi:hypothetical protein